MGANKQNIQLPPQAHITKDGIFSVGGGKYGWELRAKAHKEGDVAIGVITKTGAFASIPHRAARALAHYLLARCPSDTLKM
jgi:hypothetical protein